MIADLAAGGLRLSAKGEYAIKAVLHLAMHRESGLVPIQDIAASAGIPQRYLEQVLLALKRAGLVTSKRGSAGGYHLTRPPAEITVGAVLRAVEGNVALPTLGANGHAPDGDELVDLWRELADAVSHVIDRLTFGELVERARERHSVTGPMYYI